jgi:FKBP-type peptidyl-prolyl cis-trans isomerase
MKVNAFIIIAAASIACAAAAEPGWRDLEGYATTYKVLEVGPRKGAPTKKGDSVTVHATGVVVETGQKFWSTKDPGQSPFTYNAGVGSVITGWDQGTLGMHIGESREINIPAHEGYGAGGFPAWGIPKMATLNFTIEVLSINGKSGDEL